MSNDSDSQLAWNDNSGQEGPGSIINNLSWDTASGRSAPEPDRQSQRRIIPISRRAILRPLSSRIRRLSITGTSVSDPQGVSATITNFSRHSGAGDCRSGSVSGDPTGARTVYPMAAIVKVAVPKYTAANLEVCTDAPTTTGLTEIAHNEQEWTGHNRRRARRLLLHDARLHRPRQRATTIASIPNTSAYRNVAVMVGVPVDMGMSIDQPTIDLGTVTAGFADQTGLTWKPYLRSSTSLADPTQVNQGDDDFAQYYQPLTIRNNGNVNLMNVHVDSNVLLDGAADTQSYIRLTSDQAETPYSIASGLSPDSWTDSLSFIPSIDPRRPAAEQHDRHKRRPASAQLAGHGRLPAQRPGAGPNVVIRAAQPYAVH